MRRAFCCILTAALLQMPTSVVYGAPKFQPGKTYCQCACRNSTGTKDLTWELVNSCAVNGQKCKFNNPSNENKLESGRLRDCMRCSSDAPGSLSCDARTPLREVEPEIRGTGAERSGLPVKQPELSK
jgi:hypothetical protein